jgi:hypothetical protein
MILTAHQPVYMPWLGLYHKIFLAEKFCVFDIAQYQTKDFNNRNKIKTNNGSIWLSVPVESKNHFQKKLCDIKIINNGWNKKHFKSIDISYRKSQYYHMYIDKIEYMLLGKSYEYLTDLNFSSLQFGLDALGIKRSVVKASDLNLSGKKSDLVLDMCIKLGCSDYIFGSEGKNYAIESDFLKNGIKPHFQNYKHPVYNQQHGEFIPFMSIIDLLMNEGPNSSSIIMNNNLKNIYERI